MASYLYNKEGQLWKMSVADVADKDRDQMGNVVIKMLAVKLCHWETMKDDWDRRISQIDFIYFFTSLHILRLYHFFSFDFFVLRHLFYPDNIIIPQ